MPTGCAAVDLSNNVDSTFNYQEPQGDAHWL